MTERLSALLHDHAGQLEVPAPDAARIVARGRSLRHRRRLGWGGAAAALLLVGAVYAPTVLAGDGDDTRVVDDGGVADATAGAVDLGTSPVVALDDTLYLLGQGREVRLDEVVQTIYYTSAGFLVRSNETGASDGGAPFHLTLVSPDGTAEPLDLVLGEVVPSTDATQPYLAYADTTDAGVPEVVVLDVSTRAEVARVEVPEVTSWGGWEAPPVSLDGDVVYVGGEDATVAVDWRTGETRVAEGLPGGFPSVQGGHGVAYLDRGVTVLDVATGKSLVEPLQDAGLRLSPDGRFAVSAPYDGGEAVVWDLDAGTEVTLDGPATTYGWTPDGRPFAVDGRTIWVCDVDSGACTSLDAALPAARGDAFPRLAGFAYES